MPKSKDHRKKKFQPHDETRQLLIMKGRYAMHQFLQRAYEVYKRVNSKRVYRTKLSWAIERELARMKRPSDVPSVS